MCDVLEGGDFGVFYVLFDGVWMGNNGYDWKMVVEVVENDWLDLVVFGWLCIFNLDLVECLKK